MRDLGEAGESAFSSWCAISGITANKSIKDRHGWDVYIEFDSGVDISNASRLHEPLIECKVQVKSTDGSKRALQIPLSNLKAMATTPYPTFYVLLEYDGTESPVRAFLLHVSNDLISEILQRVRKATTTNKKSDLHKKTMQIKFGPETEIQPLSGCELKTLILNTVGSSPSAYIKAKQFFLESVGFEEGAYSVNFSVDGDDNFTQFVNMCLGINGQAEVNNVCSFATRFGISNVLPELTSDSAVLQISDVTPDGEGTVHFRNRNTGLNVRYSVSLFRGGLASWVPEQYRKFRLSSDLFDIQISTKSRKMNIEYKLSTDATYDVTEHIKIYNLCKLLSTPNDVDFQFTIDSHSIKGKLNRGSEPQDFSIALSTLEALSSIKSYFNFYDPLPISIDEIRENQQVILNIKKLITPQTSNISFILNTPNPPALTDVECIYVIAIRIAGIVFIDAVSLRGDLLKTGVATYELTLHNVTSIYKTTSPIETLDEIQLKSDVRKAVDNYSPERPAIDVTSAFFSKELIASESVAE